MVQQFQPGQSIQPFQPTIDYNLAIWQAYTNCINSFQSLELMSTGLSGMTFAATHVSQDRFIQNVGILQQMILDNWKDETYLTDLEELDLIVKNIRADRSKSVSDVGVARLKFKAITELLHRRGFFPETEQVSLLK